MRGLFWLPVVLGLSTIGLASQAEAGCVSGAIIGGIAGHVLGHHGAVGAAAGCAIGSIHHNHRWHGERYSGGYGRPYRY
jgi:hypothetical protein